MASAITSLLSSASNAVSAATSNNSTSTNATSTSSTSNNSSASTSSTTGGQQINQSTFLQLLVAQLQNQDPMQPMDGMQFVTQLAQFAQVEQSENQTSELTTMSSQLSGLANNETAQLVGQTVTIQGNTVNWNGTVATPSSATLASAASSVTATIVNSAGTTIRTITLPSEPAGALSIPWDGRDDSGANAPSGNYTVNVTATDSTGAPVTVTPSVTGKVQSISFAQGYAEITLASGAQAPVSQLVSVGAASTTP